ncbi:hypothetical protein BCEN4_740054 [Burkholderia cenocepacia]|nr:hypothetical protein BCEN4_740054 [Burkholderia cenocepacia]
MTNPVIDIIQYNYLNEFVNIIRKINLTLR